MRILVVGAGAVGGYFGGRLVQAGRDVTFLVRASRAAELEKKGLQIVSPHGDVTLHPKTITANQISAPFDVIVASVKSYALSSVMDDVAPAVGPASIIFPALNGMRHMDLLVARFGQQAVVGGVCLIAAEVDAHGRIRQLADFQKLIYGELDGERTPRLDRLDKALSGAGFDTAISDHIMQDMWQKWVLLATLGAINCLLRGSIGEVTAISGGAELSLALLRECSGIAAACGYPQAEEFLQRQNFALTARNSQMTSSMYRDLTKGASVEVDTILGDLLERGRQRGLVTPLLQAAFVNLSIYQRGLDRK